MMNRAPNYLGAQLSDLGAHANKRERNNHLSVQLNLFEFAPRFIKCA